MECSYYRDGMLFCLHGKTTQNTTAANLSELIKKKCKKAKDEALLLLACARKAYVCSPCLLIIEHRM